MAHEVILQGSFSQSSFSQGSFSQGNFRERLQKEDAQIGLWLALADPYTAEICATAGFDWVLIDGEHAPNDLRRFLSISQALAAYDSHPIVRLPHDDPALIKQTLEIGITTLMIPMVETKAQAESIVRSMRYPPEGIRGVGSGLARSSRWGLDSHYLSNANERVELIVQIETIDALQKIGDIAQIDGVTGVFIGPSDLSASMGLLGKPTHPDVISKIDEAITLVTSLGKAIGVLAPDPKLANHYISKGASFVAVGVDATLLAQSTRLLAKQFIAKNTTSTESVGEDKNKLSDY